MKNSKDNLPFWMYWGAVAHPDQSMATAQPSREPHPVFTAWRMLLVLSLLVGLFYPWVVTGIAKVTLRRTASGSIVQRDGKSVGSELLAQRIVGAQYFWPRPSTGDDGTNYATVASSASNLGPTSSNLL